MTKSSTPMIFSLSCGRQIIAYTSFNGEEAILEHPCQLVHIQTDEGILLQLQEWVGMADKRIVRLQRTGIVASALPNKELRDQYTQAIEATKSYEFDQSEAAQQMEQLIADRATHPAPEGIS